MSFKFNKFIKIVSTIFIISSIFVVGALSSQSSKISTAQAAPITGQFGLLWANSQTGDSGVWKINKSDYNFEGVTGFQPVLDTSWQMAKGTASLDENSSLVGWFNTTTKQTAMWVTRTENGQVRILKGHVLSTVEDPNWQLMGIGKGVENRGASAKFYWKYLPTGEIAAWNIDFTDSSYDKYDVTIVRNIPEKVSIDPADKYISNYYDSRGYNNITWYNPNSGIITKSNWPDSPQEVNYSLQRTREWTPLTTLSYPNITYTCPQKSSPLPSNDAVVWQNQNTGDVELEYKVFDCDGLNATPSKLIPVIKVKKLSTVADPSWKLIGAIQL